MESARFDDLLRTLASGRSRRATIGVALSSLLGATALGRLADDVAAKKHKKKKKKCKGGTKKCGKKCIPEDNCCIDGDCSDACTSCQSGVCVSACEAGDTCLANGSCGKTCATDAQCNPNPANPTCACAGEDGDEPVCRVPADEEECQFDPTCTTTRDCPAGSVCVSHFSCPNRCLALCDL